MSVSAIAGLDMASDRLHLYCSNGMALSEHAKGDPDERRHRLFEAARHIFGLLPAGTLVCAEEPLALARNGKTTRLLGLAAGAIWAAHLDYPLWWTWVDVATWKRVVVGNGNADKDAIGAWVREHLGLEFTEQDFYDAACLARYGVIQLGRDTECGG